MGKDKKKSGGMVVGSTKIASLYSEDIGKRGVKRLYDNHSPSLSISKMPLTSAEKKRRKERKMRFGGKSSIDPLYKPLSSSRDSKRTKTQGSTGSGPLVGENTNLEKPYLRLTDFPKKEDVRPIEVLVKSLAHIKRLYIRDEDFQWANEQLKSVRQDLTVQRLRNSFVLEVYETHARILLEEGDLNEFNQCQTVIQSLVDGSPRARDDTGGAAMSESSSAEEEDDDDRTPLKQSKEDADEFRGYALLYALVSNSWAQLKIELARVESAVDLNPHCQGTELSSVHALQVVKAVEESDYRTFFRLYENAPHLSAYLMDFLVKRVRDAAYERIIAAYRPTVSIEHIRDCLLLQDLEETRRFLRQHGAVFVEEKGEPPFWIDCKASISQKKK